MGAFYGRVLADGSHLMSCQVCRIAPDNILQKPESHSLVTKLWAPFWARLLAKPQILRVPKKTTIISATPYIIAS